MDGHEWYLTSGRNGAASRKPGSCRAGVTVIIRGDGTIRFRRAFDLGNVDFPVSHILSRGLVKIAIIKIAVP